MFAAMKLWSGVEEGIAELERAHDAMPDPLAAAARQRVSITPAIARELHLSGRS